MPDGSVTDNDLDSTQVRAVELLLDEGVQALREIPQIPLRQEDPQDIRLTAQPARSFAKTPEQSGPAASPQKPASRYP